MNANDFLSAYLIYQKSGVINNQDNTQFSASSLQRIEVAADRLNKIKLYTGVEVVQNEALLILTDLHDLLPVLQNELINGQISGTQLKSINKIGTIIDGIAQILLIINSEFVQSQMYTQLLSLNSLASSHFNTIDELVNFAQGKAGSSINEIEKRAYRNADTFSFDKLSGIAEEKRIIRNAIEIAQIPNSGEKGVFILLTGPPGTGKSRLGIATANFFSNGLYYNLDLESLSSPTIGKAENDLVNLFNKYKESGEKVTFILDECDQVLGENVVPHLSNIRTIFQTQLEGASVTPKNFLFIGMTNYYNKIPPAIKRRVDARVYVRVPTDDELVAYLIEELNLKKLGVEPQFGKIPNLIQIIKKDGVPTFANIKNLLRQARGLTWLNSPPYFQLNDSKLIVNSSDLITMPAYSTMIQLTESLKASLYLIPNEQDFVDCIKNVTWMTVSEEAEFRQNNE